MKKLQALVVAALLMGSASIASAQEPQPQPQGAGRGMGRGGMQALMQGITLTAEQQAKVDSIGRKYMAQRQEMMQDQSMDQDARRAKMREMMTKQQDEIKAVLTAEQRTVYEKNVADMQARMQQQGGGQRPPQR
jgi:Spy/CpxP family protein refolding chaperone